jgi:hypothetical protein
MAARQPGRSEAAKRALALLRTAAARAQRENSATDEEIADVLDSLHGTYFRRARRSGS